MVTRVPWAMLGAPLNAKAFGAVGDGTAADYPALAAMVAEAKMLTCPHLIIPPGTYALGTNTLDFDLPNGSIIDCFGEFTSTIASAAPAVRIGKTAANPFWYVVRGLKVRRLTNDASAGSIGVEVRNTVWADIDIRSVVGFHYGVKVFGTAANGGVSYCQFYLGQLHDNRVNLYLDADGVGYCNENNFYGGSFNHSSAWAAAFPATSSTNLHIEHFATSELNNNRFFGPSFEDKAPPAVAAIINGNNNVIYHPRIERITDQSTYEIQFTADSGECAVVGSGFYLIDTNINDLGTNNCYETRYGRRISHQTPASGSASVLDLQSTASSAARLVQLRNAANAVTGWIDGSAKAQLTDLLLTNLGDYADDTAAAAGGVALNQFYRTGSAIKVRVS